MDQSEIDRRFSYHAPSESTRELHDIWREREKDYAGLIEGIAGGDTREKSLAFTKLEELVFWVHAHIARNL
jgi:hypothetical protein